MYVCYSRGHGRCETEPQQNSDDSNDTETPYVNTTETQYVNTSLNLNLNPGTDATDSHYEYVPMGNIEDQYDDACMKPIVPATDDTHYEIPVNSGDARNESQYEDLVRDPYSNIDVESPYEPLTWRFKCIDIWHHASICRCH
jgi:hypothetical protein